MTKRMQKLLLDLYLHHETECRRIGLALPLGAKPTPEFNRHALLMNRVTEELISAVGLDALMAMLPPPAKIE